MSVEAVSFDKEEMARLKNRLNVRQGKMSCHANALTVTETLGLNQCQSVKVVSLDKRGTSTLKKGC